MVKLFKIAVLLIVLLASSKAQAEVSQGPVISAEFKKIDNNQDGFISSSEMQAYQAKTFEGLDKDKNKELNSGELEADQTGMHKKSDQNQDGRVTQDELVDQDGQDRGDHDHR